MKSSHRLNHMVRRRARRVKGSASRKRWEISANWAAADPITVSVNIRRGSELGKGGEHRSFTQVVDRLLGAQNILNELVEVLSKLGGHFSRARIG